MARPPFTFERNALRSNGSFALRFIASPPFAGLILKRRPFYSIAPRRDNPLAAAPHTLAREGLSPAVTLAWVRAVNGIRVIFDESRASGRDDGSRHFRLVGNSGRGGSNLRWRQRLRSVVNFSTPTQLF